MKRLSLLVFSLSFLILTVALFSGCGEDEKLKEENAQLKEEVLGLREDISWCYEQLFTETGELKMEIIAEKIQQIRMDADILVVDAGILYLSGELEEYLMEEVLDLSEDIDELYYAIFEDEEV